MITRYLLATSQYAATAGRVKAAAFLPSAARLPASISVFEIDGLAEPAIWALGKAEVAIPRDKPLYARADLESGAVTRAELRLVQTPPPRHANLLGWPSDRSDQQLVAMRLSQEAQLVLNPTGT